jgi:hypothetical protein
MQFSSLYNETGTFTNKTGNLIIKVVIIEIEFFKKKEKSEILLEESRKNNDNVLKNGITKNDSKSISCDE